MRCVSKLVFQNVDVKLGEREVLNGVSFEAERGEVLGILGPNGAGKTTLLRAALGLVPYQGAITLRGQDLSRLPPLERAKLVAYVPQQSQLSAPLTVREVVELGRYANQPGGGKLSGVDVSAVECALVDCDLEGFEHRLFTRLSGGEQRRVLLARALATEAPWILMDEPTAALDIPHALSLGARVRALAATGKSVFVVLHNLDEARQICDRVLLLKSGRVYGLGPVTEMIAETAVLEVFGVELLRGAGLGYRLPAAQAIESE
ncbi:MAG: hypothetical protein RJA70_4485 [Pseudomonadota bacterium]|jgi:iron complex transport system ATP-binding protein